MLFRSPGFGFLAENSQFVELCEMCGLTFIGPRSETIELMGNKANARIEMQKHQIPVIPGSKGFLTDATEAKRVAKQVGYPVLLKAAAGGGGKGIRRVDDEAHLEKAFDEAKREAKASFGDERMYLEKIMEDVKHIEMQIFRDLAGHTVYFPERDCSLQRNKQKMLEESPSDLLSPKERKTLSAPLPGHLFAYPEMSRVYSRTPEPLRPALSSENFSRRESCETHTLSFRYTPSHQASAAC